MPKYEVHVPICGYVIYEVDNVDDEDGAVEVVLNGDGKFLRDEIDEETSIDKIECVEV